MNDTFAKLGNDKHFATVTLPDGRKVQADFTLRGFDTQLVLHSDKPFEPGLSLAEVHGHFENAKSVSFLDCVFIQESCSFGEERRMCSTTFFPHFVAIGDEHVLTSTRIATIAVLVGDAPEIFYDFDAFGIAWDPATAIGPALARPGATVLSETKVGDDPLVAYFRGDRRITSATTASGEIVAAHWLRWSTGGSRRVAIESDIMVAFELAQPVVFSMAIKAILAVIRFLELVAGRGQSVLNLTVMMDGPELRPWADVYWSMRPPTQAHSTKLSPRDLPINGALDRESFGQVMAKWIDADPARIDARCQYSACLKKERSYDIDRLVAAANMFDVLPPEASPKKVTLTLEMEAALVEAKKLFRRLLPTEERDGILAALGRAKVVTLKKKVRHRGEMVSAKVMHLQPGLSFILEKAVDCRNHFVHGTPTLIDFQVVGSFLTNALEFVFGASELLEYGWDIQAWLRNGSSQTHPWGEFLLEYKDRLALLQTMVAKPVKE